VIRDIDLGRQHDRDSTQPTFRPRTQELRLFLDLFLV
jgi:hypothetical protein